MNRSDLLIADRRGVPLLLHDRTENLRTRSKEAARMAVGAAVEGGPNMDMEQRYDRLPLSPFIEAFFSEGRAHALPQDETSLRPSVLAWLLQ